MRVLMVCSDPGVRIGGGNGPSLHLRAVRDSLLELGHDVRLAGVAAPDPALVRSWGPTCRTVTYPSWPEGVQRARRTRAVVERVHGLAGRVADRWQPDVVYERLSRFGTAGRRVADRAGVPHILEVNSVLEDTAARWPDLSQRNLALALEAKVLARAALRVVVSQEVAEQVDAVVARTAAAGRGSGPGRTLVVPNGVDAGLFAHPAGRAQARHRIGIANGTFAAGYAGALRPGHGLDVALAALTWLDPDVHLIVAGDGPDRDRLRDRAQLLGIDHRVHWLGQVAHDRVPQVLAACDVAIAPYLPLAGFGLSPLKLYEYLAAGLPVVASDLGQLRDVLGGAPAGRLVTPGDPMALATALAGVRADPTIGATALGRAAAAAAEHSWTRRVAQIMDELLDPAGQEVAR